MTQNLSDPVLMKFALLFTFCLSFLTVLAQQVADTAYAPVLSDPEYNQWKGPVVFIDEGHHNFHTKNGRYLPFANLLERDGYVVKNYAGKFTKSGLEKGKILVISNALNRKNKSNWFLPTPSAFSSSEIEIVRNLVESGGSLFLIADHMPMAGAATELGAAFGFEFGNGYVMHDSTKGIGFFNTGNQTLAENDITLGRNNMEKVNHVVSFTGQGFKIPSEAIAILPLNEHYTLLLPDTAGVFTKDTPRKNMKGWSQGAYRKYGKGRVVVFGEAAMFTAQIAGTDNNKVVMNDLRADQNYRLLLNILHWLDGE